MKTVAASILEATSDWFEDMIYYLIDKGLADDPDTLITELNRLLSFQHKQHSDFDGLVALYVVNNPKDEAYKFVVQLTSELRDHITEEVQS